MHKQMENLTIEQMKEIVSDAPEGAELFNKFYIRNVHSEGYMDHFAKWNGCKWQQAEAHREFVDEAICLNDLRTTITTFDKEELEALSEQDDLFDQFEREFFANQSFDDIAKHDSREFKVGDLVCFIDSRIMFPDGETKTNELFKVIRSDGLEVDLTEIDKLKVYKTWVGDLRHATPSEIKAGHRLEAERHG